VLQWTSLYKCLCCIPSYVLWGLPRSKITGSLYGSSSYSFLWNLYTAFHSIWTNLHSHKQCIRLPILQPSRQHLALIMAIWPGVRWNLSVILICMSFITREAEHLFMYLLAICTSSFENSLPGYLLISTVFYLLFNSEIACYQCGFYSNDLIYCAVWYIVVNFFSSALIIVSSEQISNIISVL
jgi:hypothetical protein